MHLQYRLATKTVDVPPQLQTVMSQETFEKARLYTIDKCWFSFVKDTFSILITSAVLYFGILAAVWNCAEWMTHGKGEVLTSCTWLFLLSTCSTAIDLPLTVYHTFVLEEKYGFNKQTVGFFLQDKIKEFALNQVILLSVASLAIVIVKHGGDWFFVWLWLIVCILVIVLLTVYPLVIAPLFDKYTPLPDGPLRKEIEKLASQLNFPLAQLYVVEGSKRSTHSNAYFYGLFKTKRIVLFDTLLAKPESGGCTDDEILAVLSHELGHWKHSHIIKNLLIMQVNLFLMFSVFAFMFKYSLLYRALGFYKLQPVLVGLLAVMQYVMMPYNALLSFLLTCLSRRFEFQADFFAARLGKAEPLVKALIQLNKDNLGFPIYDKYYSAWHHSHPPLLERLAALQSNCETLKNK